VEGEEELVEVFGIYCSRGWNRERRREGETRSNKKEHTSPPL
jgi:hypothetical protein